MDVLPRMLPSRRTPSMQCASRRPLPSIFRTCAYSWPSSLNTSSRLMLSASFFPLRLFLPPCLTSSLAPFPHPYPIFRRSPLRFSFSRSARGREITEEARRGKKEKGA